MERDIDSHSTIYLDYPIGCGKEFALHKLLLQTKFTHALKKDLL